jgi:hypothetical protein
MLCLETERRLLSSKDDAAVLLRLKRKEDEAIVIKRNMPQYFYKYH